MKTKSMVTIPYKCPYGKFSCKYVDANSCLDVSCIDCECSKQISKQVRDVKRKHNDAKYAVVGAFIAAVILAIYYTLKNNNIIQ